MSAPKRPMSPGEARRRFLELYLADHEAGLTGELGEYELLFPGCEEAVAAEYARFHGGGEVDPSADEIESIGPYRLIRELARGGLGLSCLAHDTRVHRRVSLRILSGLPGCSRLRRIKMRWDAEAASKLRHPGLAKVLEVGEVAGIPFVVMPFTEGLTLAAILAAARAGYRLQSFATAPPELGDTPESAAGRRGPATRAAVLEAARGIARVAHALHAAHRSGLLHRALQPANVLVGEDGQPVVLDFGVAHVARDDAVAVPYAAPELLTRRGGDPRSDVYSLGVILHECLTLERPFEAVSRAPLYREITGRRPADPRLRNPLVPGELAAVLARALAPRRQHRYASALAFAEDLDRVWRGDRVASAASPGPRPRPPRRARSAESERRRSG